MATYNVYEHPFYGRRIEKRGFSLLAFFFPLFWLPVKRLWKPFLMFLVIYFIIVGCFRVIDNLVEEKSRYINSMSPQQLDDNRTFASIYWREVEPHYENMTTSEKREEAKSLYIEHESLPLYYMGIALFLVNLLVNLLAGWKSRQWMANKLERRGFHLKEVVSASSKDQALAKLYN